MGIDKERVTKTRGGTLMKHPIPALLAAWVLALSFLACGSGAATPNLAGSPETTPPVPSRPTGVPPPPGTSQPTATPPMQIIEEEIIEKVETDQGVELRRTVRVYRVTPVPPLEELVKIGKVEADEQIEIVGVEITPGVGPPAYCRGAAPCPPHISFMVVATSRNHGPAATIRTQITIEDPLAGETHTTHVDEFVGRDAQTGPHLGFIVEPKQWIAHVEVRIVP